jgi:hypothetical protein
MPDEPSQEDLDRAEERGWRDDPKPFLSSSEEDAAQDKTAAQREAMEEANEDDDE